nr:cytochrome P450 71A3-like [Ipomoea batatas]
MNLSMYYYLFPLFISILFLSRFLFSPPRDRKNLPPSPPKLPLLGNILQLGSLPHRALQQLSTHYGPLMLLHFGSVPVLVASSPDAAREIMKDHDLAFSDRPANTMASRLLYGYKDVAFAPYGEYWRQVRSICVLHLLSNTRVQSFRNVREEETRLMVEKIRQLSSSGSLINLSDVFIELTNDIVCRVALGRKYSKEGNFKMLLGEFLELLGTFNVGDYIPWLAWVNRINGLDRRVEKNAKELDEFIDGVVEEHIGLKKEEGDGLDFVNILLQIQREDKIGFPIHRDSVKALVLDMFSAGTHTVYTLLEWTMAELIKNPNVMKKLSSEVRTLKTCDDLETIQYLKAVIKETLRLHPPIPLLVPRKAIQDVNVMDFHVETGTQVIVNSWAIGRDPIVWENPEEFKPERFLNSNVDYKGMHFELIPFGAGRRGCPGVTFTANLVELALVTLVREFDFTSIEEDLDMSEATGFTANKKIPLTRKSITATARQRLSFSVKKDLPSSNRRSISFSTNSNRRKSNEIQESDFKDAASVCLPLITAAIRDIEKDVFPKFCSLNVEIPTSPLAEMLLLLFCNEQSSRLGNGHQFLVYPKGRGVALRLTTQRKSIEVVESVGVAGKSDPKQTAKSKGGKTWPLLSL